MKKASLYLFCIGCCLFWSLDTLFNHGVGGEIRIHHVSGNTFRANLRFLRYTGVIATPPNFTMWVEPPSSSGLAVFSVLLQVDSAQSLNNNQLLDLYYGGSIVFPDSSLKYTCWIAQCCRTFSILNMSNSSSQQLGLMTEFTPFVQGMPNSSPWIRRIPEPAALSQQWYSIALDAVDPDGDSLVYRPALPVGNGPSDPIISSFPWNIGASSYLFDQQLGIFLWKPVVIGQYVWRVNVEEWRAGQMIGLVGRDVLIAVMNVSGFNHSPQIVQNNFQPPPLFLYEHPAVAGQFFQLNVSLFDPDLTQKSLRFQADFMLNNPAVTQAVIPDSQGFNAQLNWNTLITDQREKPYLVLLKYTESSQNFSFSADIPLFIKVSNSALLNPLVEQDEPYCYLSSVQGRTLITFKSDRDEFLQLEVFSMNGQRMLAKELLSKGKELQIWDISHLLNGSGVQLIRLSSQNAWSKQWKALAGYGH
jgi:hypothetical protein